jgi:hypothetical protein
MTIGFANDENPSPNSTSYTYTTHNQNSGADGFLFLEVCVSATYTVTGATWDGTSMTQLDTNLSGNPPNLRLYRFYLDSPATGTNDLVISFNTTYTTSFGFFIQSFTGCSGISDSAFTGLANSPHNDTMTVADDDVLYGSGMSLYTISTVNIDGTDFFSPNFSANASVEGDRWTGEISGLLTAGTSNSEMDTGAPSFQVTNHWVLFGDAGGGGGGSRRIFNTN